jgi:hypothetical protein
VKPITPISAVLSFGPKSEASTKGMSSKAR